MKTLMWMCLMWQNQIACDVTSMMQYVHFVHLACYNYQIDNWIHFYNRYPTAIDHHYWNTFKYIQEGRKWILIAKSTCVLPTNGILPTNGDFLFYANSTGFQNDHRFTMVSDDSAHASALVHVVNEVNWTRATWQVRSVTPGLPKLRKLKGGRGNSLYWVVQCDRILLILTC